MAGGFRLRSGRRPQAAQHGRNVDRMDPRHKDFPLTPDVVLTGRDEDAAAVLKWLLALRAHIIQAEARTRRWLSSTRPLASEPIGLPGAAVWLQIRQRPAGSWWTRHAPNHSPDRPRSRPRRTASRRRLPPSVAAYGPGTTNIVGARRLSRPWKFDLQIARLAQAGAGNAHLHRPRVQANSITIHYLACRRLRQVIRSPGGAGVVELIAAMFAGAWVETSAKDRKIMSDLAGRSYEELEVALASLTGLGGRSCRAMVVQVFPTRPLDPDRRPVHIWPTRPRKLAHRLSRRSSALCDPTQEHLF